jgi:hypothetical protein
MTTVTDTPTLNQDYVFDNAWQHAGERLTVLQAAFDQAQFATSRICTLNQAGTALRLGLAPAPLPNGYADASDRAAGSWRLI